MSQTKELLLTPKMRRAFAVAVEMAKVSERNNKAAAPAKAAQPSTNNSKAAKPLTLIKNEKSSKHGPVSLLPTNFTNSVQNKQPCYAASHLQCTNMSFPKLNRLPSSF